MVTFAFSPAGAPAYDARINPFPDADGYIVPHSAGEKLAAADLAGLDVKTIELAKNEIFARHGLVFQHESMNVYFGKKAWYKADGKFVKSSMSKLEWANVKLMEDIISDPQKLKDAETAAVRESAKKLDDMVRAPQKTPAPITRDSKPETNPASEIAAAPEKTAAPASSEAQVRVQVQLKASNPKDAIDEIIESFRASLKEENSADAGAGRYLKDAKLKQAVLDSQKPVKKPVQAASGKGGLIVATAKTQIGKPYRYGSSDPKRGFDCSGLISWVYGQHGIKTPRSTPDLQKAGVGVPLNQMRPGDIVITTNRRSPHGLHAGIYAGNGEMIHAPGRRRRVIKVKMTYFNIKECRRVI